MNRFEALSPGWPALSALLDEALSLPAEQRTPWLESLAGEQRPFKDTLQRLLAAQAAVETGDYLGALPDLGRMNASPAAMATSADATEPVADARVGPYRLVRELGRGGMGTVWLAERIDGRLTRQVALKLPRLAWGSGLAERLARERDILAQLEHAHIARLYDAGVDLGGRPYLAMEYVEGEPIGSYCSDRALPIAARIALLLQVASAVAYAHSKLVVHLDLKPGNILVTKEGEVRLLDFGVARLMAGDRTEDSTLTRLSGHALTLDYASPEQIRGEPLGTSSDVYSLAVVAYELLSGQRPYRLRRGSAAELEEAIASAVSPLASDAARGPLLKKQLRGDLDAILNKALKKDSAERYASIDAFVQDIRRHLDGLPVLAQPDRLGYRATKFVGRWRLQVAAAGVAAMALVAGSGVAFWQAHEGRLQAEHARTEAATAQAVQGFIEAVFRANSGDQSDPVKMRDTTARQLLDLGAQRIDTELRDAPAARLRLLQILASMYEDMVVLDRMLELQQKRVALARATTGAGSDETVLALADLGHGLETLDRRDESMAALKEAGDILDARHAAAPAERFRVDLRLASLYRRIDPAAGLVAAGRAVAYARTVAPSPDLIIALQMQGENARYSGHADRALAPLTEVVRLVEADPALGASILQTVYGALGETQQQLGDFDAAEASLRKGLSLERRPGGVALLVHMAEWRLGSFLFERGRLRESLDAFQPAAEWARTVAADFGSEPSMMVTSHGRALLAYGRVDDGEAALNDAAAMLARLSNVPEVKGPQLLFQAAAWIEQGRIDEATRAADEAERLLTLAHFPVDRWLPQTRRGLQLATGRAGQALSDFQASRAGRKLPIDPLPGEAPKVQAESAALNLAAGHEAAAKAQARQALAAIAADPHGTGKGPTEAQATLVLGRSLVRLGDAAAALPVLEQALVLSRAAFDPERSFAVAEAWVALAQCQRDLGDRAASARSLAAAKRIYASQSRVGEHHLAAVRDAASPGRTPS